MIADSRFTKKVDSYVALQRESSRIKELSEEKLIGASTHNLEEVKHAEKMFLDYISLSPINKTLSHPDTKTLGWTRASEIISQSRLPIYLLGGMNNDSLKQALSIGAKGIAGIRGV